MVSEMGEEEAAARLSAHLRRGERPSESDQPTPLVIVVADTIERAHRWLHNHGMSPRATNVRVLSSDYGRGYHARMAVPEDRVVILSERQGTPEFRDIMRVLLSCGYSAKSMEWN